MDELVTIFCRLCKENKIEPQDDIVKKIQTQCNSNIDDGILDLSNHTLNFETCTILGRVLAHDLAVQSLLLNDCMLDEVCLKELLMKLSQNTIIKTLDLRGNNIRQHGAESLGQFLKKNNSIEVLLLEWNSLGVWEASFGLFCEGLLSNSSLKTQDLRNNQIDHSGAMNFLMHSDTTNISAV